MTEEGRFERSGPAPGRSRRTFLEALGAGSLGGMLAGCTELREGTPATETTARETEGSEETTAGEPDGAEPFGDFDVIDGHVHIVARDAYGRPTLDAEEMVDWMDDNGIDRAVLLPLVSPTSFEVLSPTWWNIDQAAPYSDRFVPFGVVDPRVVVFGEDLLEDRIATWVEEGARGFGEFKVNLPIDEPRMLTVYEICGAYDLPIVIHMDELRARDEPGLPGLEGVLQEFPDVDFVMHSKGWWANIDASVTAEDMGGYPGGEVTDPGAVDRLLRDYDNVYASIDSWSGWNALSRDFEYAQEFLERHHEQVVYGSDKIYGDQDVQQFALLDRFDLSDAAWRGILSENLVELLRDPEG